MTTAPGRTERRPGGFELPGRVVALSVAGVVALLVPGVLAFGPVFGGAAGYRAAGGGVLIGLAVAVLARWRRWSVTATAAVVVGAYLLFGGVFALPGTTIAGVVPSLDTLIRLVPLTVQSWRDLLTVSPPADSFTGPAVVPYLSGLLAGVLAGWFALGRRFFLVALLPAAALLAVGIAWGLREAPLAGYLGLGLGAVALVWARWRTDEAARRTGLELIDEPASAAVRRFGAAAALVAVGVAAGLVAGPLLGGGIDRQVLRDTVTPPPDPRSYASPLTLYRSFELDNKDVTLFTVTGLPENARVRLAALDTYDGTVYRASGDSASFVRVGQRVEPSGAAGTPATLELAIAGYSGVWLPGGGDLRGLRFTGPRAAGQAEGLHYNAVSGTVLTTVGVVEGDRYTVELTLPATTSDPADPAVADLALPANSQVPEVVGRRALDLAGDAPTPGEQLRNIEQHLRTAGYYTNGNEGDSRAGHTAQRIAAFLNAPDLVGGDEQYAVAMALMARELGIPARVVVGFYPDAPASGPIEVTGAMAHVWVEVPVQGGGWVTYDPTPPRDRVLQTTAPKPKPTTQPQVLPPPAAPPELQTDPLDEPGARDDPHPAESGWWRQVLPIVATVLGVGAGLAAPFVLIAAVKRRRRARRRTGEDPVARFSGGWDELVDAATDLGVRVAAVPTRGESALALAEVFPAAEPARIAAATDAAVFGPSAPSEQAAEEHWRVIDGALAAMLAGVGRFRRFRARFSLRSLGPRRGSVRIPSVRIPRLSSSSPKESR